MSKFIMGLLLGLILGIGGTAAFLISAQGGDYLVVTSPRVRELEASLKQADQERTWLREQVKSAADVAMKLESRFVSLATRFEELGVRMIESSQARSAPAAQGATGSAPTTPGNETSAAPAAAPQAKATTEAKGGKSPKAPSQKKAKTPQTKTAGGDETRPTPAGNR